MAEGNQFLIQLIFTRCIYEFLLHGSGTIYFISILLNEKEKKNSLNASYCVYARNTEINEI